MKKTLLLAMLPLFLFSNNYSLSTMEKKSIQIANKWIENNTKIEKQPDGSLGFYYGDNMPSVICKPLNATIIKLGKGEEYKSLRTGDSERWKFDVVENATDGRTFVLVKPTQPNIMSNVIIFTDQRMYNIKLISSPTNWTPSISFIYNNTTPNFSISNHSNIEQTQKKPIKKLTKQVVAKSKFIIKSNGFWKPTSIFIKKGKTYIHIGDKNINNIRLYLINKNIKKTIKYSYRNKYLVVNAIIKKAILIEDGLTKTIINIRKR